MLAGILAGQPFRNALIGHASLSRRPMKRVIEPLSEMGAQIDSVDGHAPLQINGTRLRGITYRPPVASAQVKTCLLFAGLLAEGTTRIEEAHATRDHGELALKAFGADLERSRNAVSIAGGQHLKPLDAYVPGDSSSAGILSVLRPQFFRSQTWCSMVCC